MDRMRRKSRRDFVFIEIEISSSLRADYVNKSDRSNKGDFNAPQKRENGLHLKVFFPFENSGFTIGR